MCSCHLFIPFFLLSFISCRIYKKKLLHTTPLCSLVKYPPLFTATLANNCRSFHCKFKYLQLYMYMYVVVLK